MIAAGPIDGLSFVVVSWNSAAELPELLASIERHMHGDYEVVLVDNASSDGTVENAKRWSGPLKIVELSRNHGFGAASNAGVRESAHDVIVLLNPDSLLVDDSLLELAQLALSEQAICGPELLNPDGSRQPSASAKPAGWEVIVTALFPAQLLPQRWREQCEPWRARGRTEAGWLTGACLAAPKQVLMHLGPFHERLELYGEDMELGLGARQAGVRSIYAPDVARVIHLGERSATRRFGEGRATRKIANRRRVVGRAVGPRRERLDHAAQFFFHASRYATKSALRRDASRERQWLEAAASGDSDR